MHDTHVAPHGVDERVQEGQSAMARCRPSSLRLAVGRGHAALSRWSLPITMRASLPCAYHLVTTARRALSRLAQPANAMQAAPGTYLLPRQLYPAHHNALPGTRAAPCRLSCNVCGSPTAPPPERPLPFAERGECGGHEAGNGKHPQRPGRSLLPDVVA